jgi:hypothetical protein
VLVQVVGQVPLIDAEKAGGILAVPRGKVAYTAVEAVEIAKEAKHVEPMDRPFIPPEIQPAQIDVSRSEDAPR